MLMRLLARPAFISILLPLGIYSTLECELYIAESTIPNAGIGLFSGSAKLELDAIGNGDKAIPLVDLYFHNNYFVDGFANPTVDYVWSGEQMGMVLETFESDDISAFWPGIDAMVNCHSGLNNVDKATPVYDEGGIHRSKHPGAGAVSPYNADESVVIRDIPIGGEIFKDYGAPWFLGRPSMGNIPLESNYYKVLDLLDDMAYILEKNDGIDVSPSTIYVELIREFKIMWDSRTLNAIHDFSWEDIQKAIDADDIGYLLQPNATRAIEWLNENGKCIDHVVHGRSTIDGAGSGAFAKRDLPKDTIVTGTPLIVFPNDKWFSMYDVQTCPDGSIVRNTSDGPYGQQLLLNYCFGHPGSTIVLCPYGSGVNYINHNKTRANIRVQWAKDGITNHQKESLHRQPTDSTKVALDYVATRDIAEGEELFLDYGDVWEDEWNYLFESWQLDHHSSLEEYVSATEFNTHHGKQSLLTTEEQLLNPYPDNLSTRCHWLVGESKSVFAGNVSELSNWYDEVGDNSGYECDILRRHDKNESYWVKVETHNNTSEQVSNVPREAIRFADNPYTTDLHLIGTFRQPLGIPDGILPDAWRNVIDDEDEKHCSAEEPTCKAKEKFERLRDPCGTSGDYLEDEVTNKNAKKSTKSSSRSKERGL